ANGNIAAAQMPSGQKLYLQTLLPSTVATTVVDGAAMVSFDAWMNTTRFILTEEDPSKPADVRFLHVLQGADAGAAIAPATRLQSINGNTFDGASVGTTAVFFVNDPKVTFSGTT